jgi:hypothetical protein
MQAHYGQCLYVGRELRELAQGTHFEIEHAGIRRFERAASQMASLHARNLETWKDDAFARENFDLAELSELQRELSEIAKGRLAAAPVALGLGEVALRLRPEARLAC